ncbi:MAG: branched-chain amino acid ABC transporter permease [Planctomycetes bacterium]|jgi:branched-chain amino acid transport system permease protein|nr:branched-chain amino acid ABC transporter permease [Planctomycetota bacterium]
MSTWEIILQLLITGLANGLIIALIALGYTMVYGIVELINFAHGDVMMLGCFLALTIVGLLGGEVAAPWLAIGLMLLLVPPFCAALNWMIDRHVYRPLRNAPKLTVLVSAIGVSFVCVNLGMFWGGLPMEVFGGGAQAASAKSFPDLLGYHNLLGNDAVVQLTSKEVMVAVITVPLMILLTWFVSRTRLGTAMRAVAQNPTAAQLMGIDTNRVVGLTFIIGGALAGVASVVAALYTTSISFQMGYRNGLDAFTAAVLGGIGNLPGAVLGALCIGLARAVMEGWVPNGGQWSNTVVFGVLILVLVFRPTGILGSRVREKV